MASTISTAADPNETEPHGEAANSPISPMPAKPPITSAETDDDSYGLLGTPQERLGIIRTEIRNALKAGMPLKYEFVRVQSGNALVIVISGGNACPACGWWNLEPTCANEECPTRAALSTDKA